MPSGPRRSASPALLPSLTYGRLVSDAETGEIRLFPLADNKSQTVGWAGQENAVTLGP